MSVLGNQIQELFCVSASHSPESYTGKGQKVDLRLSIDENENLDMSSMDELMEILSQADFSI
jgi:hypothetical protein